MLLKFVLIFILSYILIYFLKKNAEKLGLVDIPNERSAHVEHTPSGAGIGFSLSVMIILLLFHFDYIMQYLWTFTAIFFVFMIGVLDDRHDASPNTKFIILTFSAMLLSMDNLLISDLGVFFGMHVTMGWFAIFFNIFAIVGFTNALNLIDGLDGLAASVSMVILGTFFIVGYQYQDYFIMLLSMSFFSSLVAFLLFNWNPASIFMGDSGSLTLGFVITVLAIKSIAYLPTVSILFIAAIPIFDTIVVMLRRKRSGKSAFQADRCHFHHVLRHFFAEDTKKTVLFLVVMQMIYSITGLQLDKNMDEGYLTILFILNIAMLYIFLNAMIKRQKRKC